MNPLANSMDIIKMWADVPLSGRGTPVVSVLSINGFSWTIAENRQGKNHILDSDKPAFFPILQILSETPRSSENTGDIKNHFFLEVAGCDSVKACSMA